MAPTSLQHWLPSPGHLVFLILLSQCGHGGATLPWQSSMAPFAGAAFADEWLEASAYGRQRHRKRDQCCQKNATDSHAHGALRRPYLAPWTEQSTDIAVKCQIIVARCSHVIAIFSHMMRLTFRKTARGAERDWRYPAAVDIGGG